MGGRSARTIILGLSSQGHRAWNRKSHWDIHGFVVPVPNHTITQISLDGSLDASVMWTSKVRIEIKPQPQLVVVMAHCNNEQCPKLML